MTDKRRNFKRVEHRKHCRICWAVAQLRIAKRYYCPTCYRDVFQTTGVDQSPTTLTPKDVIASLTSNLITSRAAAELIDRVLLERAV